MFESRSRRMESTSRFVRDDGTPAEVSSFPFQRSTPFAVPTHISEFRSGRKQLIFVTAWPFETLEMRPSWRKKSPLRSVASQIFPSSVCEMEITREVGDARRSNQLKGVARSSGASLFATLAASARSAADDRLRKRFSLYVRVPAADDESKTAPDVPRAIAVEPPSVQPRIGSKIPLW